MHEQARQGAEKRGVETKERAPREREQLALGREVAHICKQPRSEAPEGRNDGARSALTVVTSSSQTPWATRRDSVRPEEINERCRREKRSSNSS